MSYHGTWPRHHAAFDTPPVSRLYTRLAITTFLMLMPMLILLRRCRRYAVISFAFAMLAADGHATFCQRLFDVDTAALAIVHTPPADADAAAAAAAAATLSLLLSRRQNTTSLKKYFNMNDHHIADRITEKNTDRSITLFRRFFFSPYALRDTFADAARRCFRFLRRQLMLSMLRYDEYVSTHKMMAEHTRTRMSTGMPAADAFQLRHVISIAAAIDYAR